MSGMSSERRLPTYAYFWYCNPDGSFRRCQSLDEISDANWKKNAPRQKSTLVRGGRRFLVSTVFIGVDHNFEVTDGSDPILFETMIFDNTDAKTMFIDFYQERYRTWEEAKVGHRVAVDWLKAHWREYLLEDGGDD